MSVVEAVERCAVRVWMPVWVWVSVCALACAPEPWPERPHVLIVTLDTTRVDHLSVYGYDLPTTPHLERLARDAVLFTRARSTSSWTLPAHASLFTGKFPPSHGARYDPEGPLILSSGIERPGLVPREVMERFRARGLAADEVTLAQLLAQAGYATGAVVAGPWLKRVFGLDRGFAFYDGEGITDLDGRPAGDVTRRASEWLRDPANRPFLLFLNYFDPHSPYRPPPDHERRFLEAARRGGGKLSAAERKRALYDAEIGFADEQLGRVLQLLLELDVYDDTLIVVTGDHGELFGEHDISGHGRYLYEPLLRVPLIVKLPRQRDAGQVVDTPVQLTDIVPLVLDRAGLPLPPEVQGRPPSEAGERTLFAEVYPDPRSVAVGQWRALYDGSYKFVWNSNGSHALYDLERDPEESRNLLEREPERARELRARLERFVAGLPEPAVAGPEIEVDAETREALKAMGYLE